MYQNKFLIANPVIEDPIFCQSVVFLFKHTTKGAEGVILNPKKEVGVIEFAFTVPVPLFSGGPCKTSGIYFIHGYEELHEQALPEHETPEFDLGIPSSFGDNPEEEEFKNKLKIMDGVYFGTPTTFGNLIETGKIFENKFRFYTGVSSWGAGQLESEIAHSAWKIMDSNPAIFFNADALDKLAEKEARKEAEKKWYDRYKPSMN